MFARIVICAVLALPATAAAQVYKCVKGAEVSYQSEPCQPDQATAKQWQPADYAPPSSVELRRIRETEQATRRRDAQLRGGTASSRRSPGASGAAIGMGGGACDEAKALRDRELYKLGPKRSIRQMRAWDEYVAKACRF